MAYLVFAHRQRRGQYSIGPISTSLQPCWHDAIATRELFSNPLTNSQVETPSDTYSSFPPAIINSNRRGSASSSELRQRRQRLPTPPNSRIPPLHFRYAP